MPLPVAHGLLGVSIFLIGDSENPKWQKWKHYLLCAFLAISPDFDYILNFFPILGGGWHHGFTHSFGFAFVLGAIICNITNERNLKHFLIYSSVISSHPVLDYLFTKSHGVELFYPFSNQRFKLDLFDFLDYSWRNSTFNESLFTLFKICFIEFLAFTPIILLILFLRRKSITSHELRERANQSNLRL